MHRSERAGWLRAAVLGSDDAIVSTASIMIGVAASAASKAAIPVAGVAGLVAGAMSMAVGEYVSVSSQRDAERADVEREKRACGSAASRVERACDDLREAGAWTKSSRIPTIAAMSLVSLAGLGAFGGHLGGAPLGRAALRVTLGGALAMAVTAAIGRILGVASG